MLDSILQSFESTCMEMSFSFMQIQVLPSLGRSTTGFLAQVMTFHAKTSLEPIFKIKINKQSPQMTYLMNSMKCRRRKNCTKQPETITVASVQKEAEQSGISHSMVGSAIGCICKSVPFHICFCKFRFQVCWNWYYSIFVQFLKGRSSNSLSLGAFTGIEHFDGCFLKARMRNWMIHRQ